MVSEAADLVFIFPDTVTVAIYRLFCLGTSKSSRYHIQKYKKRDISANIEFVLNILKVS